MTVLEEIIQLLNSITKKLDKAAEDERQFGSDLCLDLERISWQTYRMSNNIKEIHETYGG
jgi:hypothetical protein